MIIREKSTGSAPKKMQDRLWNRDTDYDTLVKWWTDWEFGVVPKECLPPDGIIVEDEGKPICAAGLYIGIGTTFSFMEWVVVDMKAKPIQTHKALVLCIDKTSPKWRSTPNPAMTMPGRISIAAQPGRTLAPSR